MKILIGTPIHETKDYAMEHWLKNVAHLDYPADIFLVGNSPHSRYVQKVRKYCKELGIPIVTNLDNPVSKNGKNCKIEYWGRYTEGMDNQERIIYCEEIIRQKVLAKNYDAWFSWECDVLIPLDTLTNLVKTMEDTSANIVVHNAWARWKKEEYNLDMAVTLIKKEVLEKHRLHEKGRKWPSGLEWYKERAFRSGGSYVDIYGLIRPIYHLSAVVASVAALSQLD